MPISKPIYLECIFFVEMTRQYSKWNVRDDESKDCCPNCNVFDQLLTQIVKYSCKVDSVDRGYESRSEATKQITPELYMLLSCRLNLFTINDSGVARLLAPGNTHRARRPSSPLPFLPVPSLEARELRESCKLPSGVWGKASAEIEFGAF